VKIYPTIIEILTFNKWSLKLTVSRSVLSYLRSMELTDVNIDANVALAKQKQTKLECGPMPNLMVALPNIGGALCSTPQSLADAHY